MTDDDSHASRSVVFHGRHKNARKEKGVQKGDEIMNKTSRRNSLTAFAAIANTKSSSSSSLWSVKTPGNA